MASRTDALHRLRTAHEAAILTELRRSGGLSRGELGRRTGLSRTTLFAIVSDLSARGAVLDEAAVSDGELRGRGRPAARITLNPRGAELIGIDLQQTRVRAVVVNVAHEVVASVHVPLEPGLAPADRARTVVDAVHGAVVSQDISTRSVAGVGVGVVGYVRDSAWANPHAETEVALVVAALEQCFGVPVVVEGNTRLATLAEITWGAARGRPNAIFVRWSTGVGGGVVVDGRLVRGSHGAAGEIGHTCCDAEGPVCYCGGRGCLEGRIGLSALLAECEAGGVELGGPEALRRAALDGDPVVAAVVEQAAQVLGRVLAAMVTQLDAECVVLGGDLADLPDLVLAPVQDRIKALSLPRAARRVDVVTSALGADAAARGAVALLLHTAGREIEDLLGESTGSVRSA